MIFGQLDQLGLGTHHRSVARALQRCAGTMARPPPPGPGPPFTAAAQHQYHRWSGPHAPKSRYRRPRTAQYLGNAL
jgi:hypothetical protein